MIFSQEEMRQKVLTSCLSGCCQRHPEEDSEEDKEKEDAARDSHISETHIYGIL